MRLFLPSLQARIAAARADGLRFAHYTSAPAAMSMVKSGEIRLRNTQCMNDSSEVRHGLELLGRAYRGAHGERLMGFLEVDLAGVPPAGGRADRGAGRDRRARQLHRLRVGARPGRGRDRAAVDVARLRRYRRGRAGAAQPAAGRGGKRRARGVHRAGGIRRPGGVLRAVRAVRRRAHRARGRTSRGSARSGSAGGWSAAITSRRSRPSIRGSPRSASGGWPSRRRCSRRATWCARSSSAAGSRSWSTSCRWRGGTAAQAPARRSRTCSTR